MPMALKIERKITMTVAKVPVIDRKSSHSVTMITRSIMGNRLTRSFFADSENAFPSITLPVIYTSISG